MKTPTRILVLTLMLAGMISCQGPFTINDNGRTVELQNDSPFEIELQGNPTTGYQWMVYAYDSAVIKTIGEPEYIADRKDVVGSGGMYRFKFQAIADGETKLVLLYQRPWEKELEPANRFVMKIIVGTMGRITAP